MTNKNASSGTPVKCTEYLVLFVFLRHPLYPTLKSTTFFYINRKILIPLRKTTTQEYVKVWIMKYETKTDTYLLFHQENLLILCIYLFVVYQLSRRAKTIVINKLMKMYIYYTHKNTYCCVWLFSWYFVLLLLVWNVIPFVLEALW